MKNKPLVFIIEDAQEMANLIKMYLEKSEIDSKIFDNAEDASKALEHEVPELFVLDLNLPGMSGFDFLQNFLRNLHLHLGKYNFVYKIKHIVYIVLIKITSL